jgi:hypothetical protein
MMESETIWAGSAMADKDLVEDEEATTARDDSEPREEDAQSLLSTILEGYSKDPAFGDLFINWPDENLTVKADPALSWNQTQGLQKEGRLMVPDWKDARRRILEGRHDGMLAGHPGRDKTIELVTRDYDWNGIVRYCTEYVLGWADCQ